MDERILAAVELIQSRQGEAFLRLMAEAYRGVGVSDADERSGGAMREAERIGLVKCNTTRVELTSAGFLVGNVAKEYCQYLDDGRSVAPPKPSKEMLSGKDVLDLGCSFGRWLWEFQRHARTAQGIEAQAEYVTLGRALSAREGLPCPKMVVGTAQELDRLTPSSAFDLVFSRLVLNYVKVKPVLVKMVAALRPGGLLWIQVDSPWSLPRQLLQRNQSWRSKGYLLLALLNLQVCILTGRQLSVASQGRMHTRHSPAYLPLWWWRAALQQQGLKNFRTISNTRALVFCAQK